MSESFCDIVGRWEERDPRTCDENCEYWKFPHLDCACELSPVFSVNKGIPCFVYKRKIEKTRRGE